MQGLASGDTICAVATPPGEGGIGVVRLSGPLALPILEQAFVLPSGNRPRSWTSHRLRLGYVLDPATGEQVDQVMAVLMRAPHSYTGEDVVEWQGHGGPVSLRRMVDLALRLGARTPQPGEFTQRAFVNMKLDLSQAEAVIDVIRARTDLSLRLALGQFRGRLSHAVQGVQGELLDWVARLEATIDFPEEDIAAMSPGECAALAEAILGRLDSLVRSADQGRVLRDGVRVVIAGKPNVGKSSLLNALLGEARAIVTDVPGTTRDSIEEWLNVQGIPMRVVDTAGIRPSGETVETLGIDRARRLLGECDLALVVLEAGRDLCAEDREVLRLAAGRPSLLVANKVDQVGEDPFGAWTEGVRQAWAEIHGDGNGGPPEVMPVSALQGEGVTELAGAMAAAVWAGIGFDHEMVGGNLRHREALYRATQHVQSARDTALRGLAADFVTIDLRAAILALGEITGATLDDAVIHRIFSQFCIGK